MNHHRPVAIEEQVEQLSAVSNTALITLWARAMAARPPDPLLEDPAAIALTERLRPRLATETSQFHQQLVADKLPDLLVLTMALRAQYFDQKARDFLLRFPRAIVVNLGAGLDTRFERLDAAPHPIGGRVRVIDLDLPPMIALKRHLSTPHHRHELLAASVLDDVWMETLDRFDDRRFIFLAEGLFMYLPPDAVKELVVAMATRFPGSEFVAEVVSTMWLRPPWSRLAAAKLQRQLHFDPDAAFQSGLDAPTEMATWHPALHFLDEWSFLDAHERKLGWLRALRHLPFARHIQYVVRYQFG